MATPTWTQTRAPYPYVSSNEPEAVLMFHPREQALWVFALGHDAGGVFRYRGGAFELVCRRDAFGHPDASFDPFAAFFDERAGVPTVVFDDVQDVDEGEPLSNIFVSDCVEGAARPRTLPPTGEFEYGDTFYAARGELFHVYRPNGHPALLRVLRDGGFVALGETPEQLAEPGTMGGCAGAFDEILGVHVFVCNDAAMTFDGTTWAEIAVPPGAGHLSDRDIALTDPTTGRVLFIQEPDGKTPSVLHRFDGSEWREIGPGPVTWQGACADPSRKLIVFFQAQRDATAPLSTFVVWDGHGLRDEGPELSGDANVIAGEAGRIEILLGTARWRPRSGPIATTTKRLWAPVVTPAGPVAFESTGAVWGLADGQLARIGDPPSGFTDRLRMASVWDPKRNATLVISGTPSQGNAMLKDVWAFDGKQLAKIAWKPPHSAIDAGAAYSPALDRLVVAGGKAKWKGAPAATIEVDGDRTASFPPATIDDPGDGATLVTDPKSGLVVGTAYGKTAVYLGGGRWEPVPAALENARGTWFDPATRTLHARVADARIRSEHACAIGDWLDALPPPQAARTAAAAAAAAVGPLETVQNLVYIGGGSNKFWAAKLEKASYTVEWGKRGAKSTTKKRHKFETAAKARASFERETRKKLDAGYVAFAGGDPRVLAGKTAHVMKLTPGAATKTADRWGGVPPHFQADTWPRCTQCKDPLAFVMLLGKHAERLPLAKHDAIAVFVCNGNSCETYDARDGNHVALLTAAHRKQAGAAPDGARIIKAKKIGYVPRFEAAAEEEIERKPAWNKVGGYPDFIQSAQTVACARCAAPMTVIAQFADDLDRSAKLNFGDRGCGYVVVCPEEHDAAFFWQCY